MTWPDPFVRGCLAIYVNGCLSSLIKAYAVQFSEIKAVSPESSPVQNPGYVKTLSNKLRRLEVILANTK